MADRLVTPEAARAHVLAHCPDKIELSTFGQRPGSEFLCGCGRCPQPDPTPEQFRSKIDAAAWRKAVEIE